MKILYDDQTFTMQRFGGVSKCFCKIAENLPQGVKPIISVIESNNIHLHDINLVKGLRKTNLDFLRFKSMYNFKGNYKLFRMLCNLPFFNPAEKINRKQSINLLREGDFDVFHATFFDDYFLEYIGSKPFVITIHDMMPEIFPQYFRSPNPETERKKNLCNKASAIIAVSHNTKNDLMRIFGVPSDKIFVVYHGGPKPEKITTTSLIPDKYFLYVGQRTAYKNFKQTLEDFSLFAKNSPNYSLVCTGNKFNEDELKVMTDLKITNRVKYIRASESDLKVLYANAQAFIYPSLYEGFGMPILESWAYGCICLLNNRSCFPEIGGNAALYFDSEYGKSSLPYMLELITSMTEDEKNLLREKGYARLKEFSWEKAARQYANIYHSLIQG